MKLRWRIRHKFAAGLLLIVAMTGLLTASNFFGLHSYWRSNKIFNYHQKQLELLGYLESAVIVLNSPVRQTDDASDDPGVARQEKVQRIDRIEMMLKNLKDGLELAAAEISFSPDALEKQADGIDEMRRHLDQLKAQVTDTHPTAVANAPSPPKWNFWHKGNERDTIVQLSTTLGQLRGVIHSEVTRHVEADRNNYRAAIAAVYSMSAIALAMLFVLFWFGYRAVFYPIRALHGGVTTLADINFDSRVHLESGDEMQELGEAFNTMADRLQGIYKDLNRQVQERSRQLIRSERLASVGFLAAGVAHEINNPLASIAFCAEALESRLQPVLSARNESAEVAKNYLDMIQQEAFRCKAITEKLLDFSRVGEPQRADTDLITLIRNVVEMVQHLGRTKNKSVLFEPNEPVWAKVNPQELKQVLLNLVVNGLESIDEGGTVTLAAREVEGAVEITVTDNGCGMTDDVLENLFEPFFTRNRTGKGTGLGLSISHLIISQHGGTLDAQSIGPDKGSTFTIRLPIRALALAA